MIFNDPTKNCLIKSGKSDWAGLPESKSLFYAGENKGLPIGNLTSQFFGNVYLNDFDHFAKSCLGLKYYCRYVDDIVMIHRDRERLKSMVPILKEYLRSCLSLELHPKKIYLQQFKKGVNFLGVFIKPYRAYAGKRIKGNFYSKIVEINGIISKRPIMKAEAESFLFSVNSYLGIMKHYETYKLRKKILKSLNGRFWQYFFLAPDLSKVSARCLKD